MNIEQLCLESPLGRTLTTDDIEHQFSQAKTWEARYRCLIELGQKLPVLDAAFKDPRYQVAGCEGVVWLHALQKEEQCHFIADSPARIIKGLLVVLLTPMNHQSVDVIQCFDIEQYFAKLGLSGHLSTSRVNGLQAVYAAMLGHSTSS